MVNGIKPLMVLCSFDVTKNMDRKEKSKTQKNKAKKRKLEFEFDSEEDEESEDEEEDLLFEHLIQEQHWSTDKDDCAYEEQDIHINENEESGTSNDNSNDGDGDFIKLTNVSVAAGMWVLVYWEGEKFLGVVKSKTRKSYHVVCLQKPYGVCEPQLLEASGDDYKTVYRPNITTPYEVDIDGTVYWQYELLN